MSFNKGHFARTGNVAQAKAALRTAEAQGALVDFYVPDVTYSLRCKHYEYALWVKRQVQDKQGLKWEAENFAKELLVADRPDLIPAFCDDLSLAKGEAHGTIHKDFLSTICIHGAVKSLRWCLPDLIVRSTLERGPELIVWLFHIALTSNRIGKATAMVKLFLRSFPAALTEDFVVRELKSVVFVFQQPVHISFDEAPFFLRCLLLAVEDYKREGATPSFVRHGLQLLARGHPDNLAVLRRAFPEFADELSAYDVASLRISEVLFEDFICNQLTPKEKFAFIRRCYHNIDDVLFWKLRRSATFVMVNDSVIKPSMISWLIRRRLLYKETFLYHLQMQRSNIRVLVALDVYEDGDGADYQDVIPKTYDGVRQRARWASRMFWAEAVYRACCKFAS